MVTDEIYEHLVYGSARFHSMPVLVPELAERCVIVNGVAKTYAMTGWRVGWLIGPLDVVKAAANLQSHSTSNVCNVAQRAALAAVTGGLEDVKEMRSVYDRRRRGHRRRPVRPPRRAVPGTRGRVLRLPKLQQFTFFFFLTRRQWPCFSVLGSACLKPHGSLQTLPPINTIPLPSRSPRRLPGGRSRPPGSDHLIQFSPNTEPFSGGPLGHGNW